MNNNRGNITNEGTVTRSIGTRADAENRSRRYRMKISAAIPRHTREVVLRLFTVVRIIHHTKNLLVRMVLVV